MNFLMAYLNAAERIEHIVGHEHEQGTPGAKKKPLVSKTKICWILLVLTVAIPLAIFLGILQFFPSLMDISQDILNERKANKAGSSETNVAAQTPWTYRANPPPKPMYPPMYPHAPMMPNDGSAHLPAPVPPLDDYTSRSSYPAKPMYPPVYSQPPATRDGYPPQAPPEKPKDETSRNLPPTIDDYTPRRAFENLNSEGARGVPPPPSSPPVIDDFERRAFQNLNAERNPYDRYHQSPRLNPNYQIFQGLGYENYAPFSAAVEDSEEGTRLDKVRSSEKLEIDSPSARSLLAKIDPNWADKVQALQQRLQHASA